MAKKGMTEKQKKFCDYYIETNNATESAIRAGYSEKTAFVIGYENLNKPYIKEYIDKRMKQLESKRIASPQEVLEKLTSIMRGEEKGTIVAGGDICQAKPTIGEMRAAATQLGKRYGLFEAKKETNDSQQSNDISKLTDEELEAIING